MSGYCGICKTKGHKSATCRARKFDYSSQLEMHTDDSISRALRVYVKTDVAVYEPAIKYLREFQAEGLSLGRQGKDKNANPARDQRTARVWFDKKDAQISTDTHVDHVIPYAQGGAHNSANSTLLKGAANQSKGATFSFESVLQAGGVKAAALAIYTSAHQGNANYGKYTGGVPAPVTFDYPYELLVGNDGLNLARNESILRDMLRVQKESGQLRTTPIRHRHTKKPMQVTVETAKLTTGVLYTKKGKIDGRCKAARDAKREKK